VREGAFKRMLGFANQEGTNRENTPKEREVLGVSGCEDAGVL